MGKLYSNRLVIDEKAYKYVSLKPMQIFYRLIPYNFLTFILVLLFLLFVKKSSYQIRIPDIFIAVFMFVSGITFYFGKILNNKTGHILYLTSLLLLFVNLFFMAIIKIFLSLSFLSWFCGLIVGGILFWLFYDKTYILLHKQNRVIFKFID